MELTRQIWSQVFCALVKAQVELGRGSLSAVPQQSWKDDGEDSLSSLGLPWWLQGENLPAVHEMQVASLGREDALEEGAATHSRALTWRIRQMEEPGGLQSTGPQQDWATNVSSLDNKPTHLSGKIPLSSWQDPNFIKER